MSVTRHPEWTQFLKSAGDYTKELYLGNQLLPKLNAEDIAEIASLFAESKDEPLTYILAGLFLELYRRKDPRFRDDSRRKVAQVAKDLVATQYPKKLGQRCVSLLILGDPTAAEQFLLSGVDLHRLTSLELTLYLHSLEYLRSPSAVERLVELEATGGEIGRLAYQSLGNIGRLSKSQLEALANQFKSERSAALLYKLFHVFLRFQIGKPVQVVRELLGEPTGLGKLEGTDCLIYRTTESHGEVKILYNDGLITDIVSDE
jgi:hypothetical protein